MQAATHYDEEYFAWQSKVGAFGGWANQSKFDAVVRPSDIVLDFGCGGGFLLKALECSGRIGVEVNPAAGEVARRNGVQVFAATSEVPDESVDVVISNHALEHVHRPLDELRVLLRKLRPGGKIVIVVPCEGLKTRWGPNEDRHLYTWSPRNLGNLLVEAGFAVDECEPYIHKWPPHYERYARFGRRFFDLVCKLYGWRTIASSFQVRAVAHRPGPARAADATDRS